MTALLGRLLSPDRLVPPSKRCGALPGAKSAVQTLMRIAWPSMLEMVLVTLVGMVDMMMVGGLGSYAISSVVSRATGGSPSKFSTIYKGVFPYDSHRIPQPRR